MSETKEFEEAREIYYRDLALENERLRFHLELKEKGISVRQLISEANSQVDLIYEAVKTATPGKSLHLSHGSAVLERKIRATECFWKHYHDMALLHECMFEDTNLYKLSKGHVKDDFKGKLLQKVVKYILGINWQYKDLAKRAREIEIEKLKAGK